jgi:hypothetical protein
VTADLGEECRMDEIAIGLLAALAGGAGGEAGKQAWTALAELVRRPLRRRPAQDGDPEHGDPDDGAFPELAALQQAPHDPARARALSDALTERAARDPEFSRSLLAWAEHARSLRIAEGTTHNTITGTVHGGAVQARDIGSITFGPPEQRR